VGALDCRLGIWLVFTTTLFNRSSAAQYKMDFMSVSVKLCMMYSAGVEWHASSNEEDAREIQFFISRQDLVVYLI
jgi:hypothetical protein